MACGLKTAGPLLAIMGDIGAPGLKDRLPVAAENGAPPGGTAPGAMAPGEVAAGMRGWNGCATGRGGGTALIERLARRLGPSWQPTRATPARQSMPQPNR